MNAEQEHPDESPYEWGVQWDDGVIAYSSYEIAAHEQQYPTRPDHVNPVLVYREVGPWEQLGPSSLHEVFSPASTR